MFGSERESVVDVSWMLWREIAVLFFVVQARVRVLWSVLKAERVVRDCLGQ